MYILASDDVAYDSGGNVHKLFIFPRERSSVLSVKAFTSGELERALQREDEKFWFLFVEIRTTRMHTIYKLLPYISIFQAQ